MELKFSCPNCNVGMEAEVHQIQGPIEVQCPQCGQQFAVDPEPVKIPVVKAQTFTPVQTRQVQVPQHPQPPLRGPVHRGNHPPQPRRVAAADDSGDKWKLIGLAGAGVALIVGVVWFLNLDPNKKNEPTAQQRETARLEEEEKAREEAAAAERAKVNEELQKVKDKLASEEKIKQQAEEERRRQEELKANEELEQDLAQHRKIVNYYAENGFNGDRSAAEEFIKVSRASMMELADRMNDGDTSNDPKDREEADRFVADRVVWHFERNELLSQWVKDHGRDTKKLVAELLRRNSVQDAGDESTPKFDFTKYSGVGSGFWISSDGWMLTNEHVVSDAKTVDIRLQDGQLLEASVVKADETADLALIKANFTPKSWLAVSKGEMDLPLGRTVFTVGYPSPTVQGVEVKFTDGRISAASGIGDRKDSYQTTVPIQHGNSGGAMVDFASGWVVGVINAKLESPSGVSADNVSYAIKSKVVTKFVDTVPEAKDAVLKSPSPVLPKGDERAVIDKATKAAVLILRRR